MHKEKMLMTIAKKSLMSVFAAAALAVPLAMGFAGTANAGFHSSFHPSFHSTYHPSFHSTPHITPHVSPHVAPHISEPHIGTPHISEPHATYHGPSIHEEAPAPHPAYRQPSPNYSGGWHNYWMWNMMFNHHAHQGINTPAGACANDQATPADQAKAACSQPQSLEQSQPQPTDSSGIGGILVGGALIGGAGLGLYAMTRRFG
jgi:hypothetical protein